MSLYSSPLPFAGWSSPAKRWRTRWLRRSPASMAPPPRPATPTKRAAAASLQATPPFPGQAGGKRVSLGGDGPAAGSVAGGAAPAAICGFNIVSPFAAAPANGSASRPPPAPVPPARRLEPELAAQAPAGSAPPPADPQARPPAALIHIMLSDALTADLLARTMVTAAL